MVFVGLPLQSTWSAGCPTLGVGLTVIVNVFAEPGQPPDIGVTVIVAVIAVLPGFIAANDGIVPTPVAIRPIDGLSLTQL